MKSVAEFDRLAEMSSGIDLTKTLVLGWGLRMMNPLLVQIVSLLISVKEMDSQPGQAMN